MVAWANNLGIKVLSNSNGTGNGTLTQVSSLPSSAVNIPIVENTDANDLASVESTLRQEAGLIEARVEDNEGNISSLSSTVSGLSSTVSDFDGRISQIEQTSSSLTSRIGSAEGNISTLQQTTSGLTFRLDNNYQTKTIPDTRNDNQSPEWYIQNYPKQVITEFKSTSVIGLSGETYCTLTTTVPWSDSSGGYPKQNAKVGTKEYWRVGTSNTVWGAWQDSLGTANSAATAASNAQSTANTARTEAADAAKTATNFLSYDATNGLLVGNKSDGSWSGHRAQMLPTAFNILDASGTTLASFGATATIGKASARNVYIDSDSVDIRNGTTILSTFGSSSISLAENNIDASIYFCNRAGHIRAKKIDENNFLDLCSENISLTADYTAYVQVTAVEGNYSAVGGMQTAAYSYDDTNGYADAHLVAYGANPEKNYSANFHACANDNTNPYINITVGDLEGSYGISIVPSWIKLYGTTVVVDDVLEVTGEIIAASNVRVNKKTINDLQEGIFLSENGYMQIQRLSGSPYIDFVYSDQAASCGRVGINPSTKYMEFTNSSKYTFDNILSTAGDLRVGDKGYNDGKGGIFLDADGYMQIQRNSSEYHPYIAFYLNGNSTTTADGQIRVNQSNGYMQFLQADRYVFDNTVHISGSIYTSAGIGIGRDDTASSLAARPITTIWKDGSWHYLLSRNEDG